MHADALAICPPVEQIREARVRHEMHVVDAGLVDLVEDPVDHRPAADGQQLLRHAVRERPEARRVAGGEGCHAQSHTPSLGDDAPSIEVSAGVTSNAGFRAGKRLVTSAGSRSSIGISAPVGVDGSIVELGATT